MTLRDPVAETMRAQMRTIEMLAQAEQEAEAARRARDRKTRQAKEGEADKLRSQLLNAADPVVIHAYLESTHAADANLFRETWQKASLQVEGRQRLRSWGVDGLFDNVATANLDLSILPLYSFSLSFAFVLAKPYLSKDDKPFYIIDNPIVRDKVFRLPLVRPSSWKGNLRATFWQLGRREEDACITRLFGEVRGDEGGQSGRLVFFPTFFEKTALEIINPHDRALKVGKNPIPFECVPAGTGGVFSLLYVPFDQIGADVVGTRREVAADLKVIAEAVQAMMTTYGFGAKTSSGFGVASEAVKGRLIVRVEEAVAVDASVPPPAPTQDPSLPRYLAAPGQLRQEYLTPEGAFRERTEAELKAMNKASRQEYDKARRWWEREGRKPAERSTPREPAPVEPTRARPAPTLLSRPFDTFQNLVREAAEVARELEGTKDG